MSKKVETKKANNPVGEYLVKRIAELESERERILTRLDLLEEKASKFEELQSLFRLERHVICLYNTKGGFEDAVATTVNDFGNYLVKLLDLKEKE